jgi:hypothetical protein
MVIKISEISKDIDTLPEEAQILLLDFIQLLKKANGGFYPVYGYIKKLI